MARPMASIVLFSLTVLLFISTRHAYATECRMGDWSKSFGTPVYIVCDMKSDIEYLNGLSRSTNRESNDDIAAMDQARCCSRAYEYWHQPTNCMASDWQRSFDLNSRWNECPQGFFLEGFAHSSSKSLHDIEYGQCCKSASHPYYYGECYDQDVSDSFNKKGLSKCDDDYYITGLFRGGCDKLSCIEKFRCCKMYPSPPALQSLSDVKTRVMDVTLRDLAKLASYLGYGWVYGCKGIWLGDDFRRSGDSWEADKKGTCDGYMAHQRLKINYGDFKFGIKDITFGEPVIQTLTPEVFLSGKVTNTDASPLKHSIEREIRIVRKVTHETTSSWKKSNELGIEISYTPSAAGGVGGKASYNFQYETSGTTTDSTSNKQYNSITIKSEKDIKPNSGIEYKIMLTKTRSTVAYTATVIAKFSAELEGFLRWGGGVNGENPNYHYKYHGSSERPTIKYRFGSSTVPFYEALKEQSDRNARPWQWTTMRSREEDSKRAIRFLTDEAWFEFTLTGQFEDVVGQHADVQWKSIKIGSATRTFNKSEKDKELPDVQDKNPPKVYPKPPEVKIATGKYEQKMVPKSKSMETEGSVEKRNEKSL